VLNSFVDAARAAFGDELIAIILYGSAVDGSLRPNSDVNVLVLLSAFDPVKAERMREPLRTAHAAARLLAMFVTESELQPAMEAFAVKFGDIRRRRHLLFGTDPFASAVIPRESTVVRLKQTLLNLTLRMREIYIARGLHDEQLSKAIGEMAGPLRACAATLRELQGQPVPSGKEALAHAAKDILGEAAAGELMANTSEARQAGALPAGKSAATFRALLELAQRLWAEAQTL
jgi:hypothetical protein